ncbi:alcohol dehydrogenase [Sneathiella sp. P13V-1]|uniref:alcohol dehydrogenase n=1 Tax=Sneathiella sp. P13V-1 TaxID=2697366 RepID=UPI001D112AF9|nr:alcohol dehydrogenase [Sneathiella sp. P13V-1]
MHLHCQQVVEFGAPLEARDYPAPEPQGTEILIKIDACGVCHSDLHLWEGYFDLGNGMKLDLADRGMSLPFTMGHEIVGEVIAVGPDVEGVEIGDKRIVFPWIGCGKCPVCQAGDELYCNNPLTLGTRYNGGYADMVIAPHPKYLIPYDGVPTELACTYACSGLTAYSALKKLSHLTEDDHVVIIGAGGVGLSAVHFASSVLKAKIIVADIDDTKRAVARQAGVFDTIDNSDPTALEKLMEITGGGAAGAIDFVGAPASAQFGMNGLRKGGTYVCVGLFGGAAPVPLPVLPLTMRTITGSYVGTLDEMHELMELVRLGKIAPIPYETRPLEEANNALEDLRDGKVKGRVVLKP